MSIKTDLFRLLVLVQLRILYRENSRNMVKYIIIIIIHVFKTLLQYCNCSIELFCSYSYILIMFPVSWVRLLLWVSLWEFHSILLIKCLLTMRRNAHFRPLLHEYFCSYFARNCWVLLLNILIMSDRWSIV